VHFEQVAGSNHGADADGLQGVRHRVDVREDLACGHVGGRRAVDAGGVCLEQPAWADLQPFDARRRDRLGAQEEPRERLGVVQCDGMMVQRADGAFSIGDIGGNGTFEDELLRQQKIGT